MPTLFLRRPLATLAAALTALTVSCVGATMDGAADSQSRGRRGGTAVKKDVQPAANEMPPVRYGTPTVRPAADGHIRIATYNVLNLFDHVDDPKLRGEQDDLPMATDDQRCRNIARVIRELDADILALEEIESKECLTWFRDKYLKDMGYRYIASEDVGYYRGVECSLLSRFPITDVTVWPNESLDDVDRDGPGFAPIPTDRRQGLTYQRSPLAATVKVNKKYEVTLFVVHHKSARDNKFHREAEAIRTLEKVAAMQERDPGKNIIVLGDFNAAPWDKSFRLYQAAGMIDTYAHRVITRDSRDDQTESNRCKTHDSGRVIDYILMNPAAYREYVIGSVFVFGQPFDPEYNWREDPYPPWYAADHYPVAIDIIPQDNAS